MAYCENCGALIKESAKFCPDCGSPQRNTEVEEPKKFCENCGAKLEYSDRFCPECGTSCCVLDEHEDNTIDKSGIDVHTALSVDDENSTPSMDINRVCLLLLFGCIILWFTAPFVAINILTLGDQPTALQLIKGDFLYLGELTETVAFWAAIISAVGLIICIIFAFKSAYRTVRTVAIVTELPLVLEMIEMLNWADDAQELFEALGFGFWSILILLFVVICVSGNKKANS